MNRILMKADYVGALAGFLCLIHCLMTPIIFVSLPIVNGFWKFLDFGFMAASWFAIYYTTLNLSAKWLTISFWMSWLFMGIILLNERFEIIHLPHEIIYIPSISLIALHFYRLKYCKCSTDFGVKLLVKRG